MEKSAARVALIFVESDADERLAALAVYPLRECPSDRVLYEHGPQLENHQEHNKFQCQHGDTAYPGYYKRY